MDPRRLLTFRTVAHERSFSRAARRLSLSQPSVSHQVALLETEVGTRLLVRARGGLRLTPAGSVLLDHADHLAWRLELAERQLARLAGERRSQLQVGAFPTAMAGLVPAAVTVLRRAHPEVRVLLREVTAGTLEPRLMSGEFDLALAYQDATIARREVPGARRVELLADGFLVCLPVGHRLAQTSGPIRLEELAHEPWVLPSSDGFLAESCRQAGFEPDIVAISGDPVATRGIVARGLAVGWVPGILRDDYQGVVLRPLDGPGRRRDIYALLPPGEPHPLAADMIGALRRAGGAGGTTGAAPA